MESQNNSEVSKNYEQPPIDNNPNHIVKVEDTAIVEYLETVRSEYEIERNKKQSFENRAGLIIALLGAICIFLEKVDLRYIIALITVPLTFIDLVIIISGLSVYGGLFFTMIMLIKTINVKQHSNFEVKSIDEILLAEQRLSSLCKIIFTYRDIIIQHRDLNEKRAIAFRMSLYGIFVTLTSMIVYINLI